MIHIALYEPEIPPNTGNIIRLCANTGARLHLIEPFGFELEDKKLRRAGLDYHEFAEVARYQNFEDFVIKNSHKRIWACTTKAKQYYHQVQFQDEDVLLLGPESRGLPAYILKALEYRQIKLPMLKNSRSLNLSNAAAVMLFEAWRQLDFLGNLSEE
ncbi:tRNA (uridine(34)/cytosine(34)/5-carboxymethylaminomethyluridine(34)-2'-O)-methyltransferase TrmL [Fastidiosibacter lacustris]|uniref:tRNA (uridine(34)/cytosine(34)/5- carboxymethylaminomethyluridine(34)-2'-O)- methyltransferase TrmL n=1 Tax=Fastidiosibacter lacustris TaxID=2056695 RepID=UPI000E342EB0|nr:tRNA (uridine(34)/cytosine(34)/5-carboxymethylaminomethyluridine(34)-2'-O)-methyltransferase TrmL [Fastidiosibacter lacustris]